MISRALSIQLSLIQCLRQSLYNLWMSCTKTYLKLVQCTQLLYLKKKKTSKGSYQVF